VFRRVGRGEEAATGQRGEERAGELAGEHAVQQLGRGRR